MHRFSGRKQAIYKRKKAKARKEAREKIKDFFELAHKAKTQALANDYIRKAINIVKKNKTRFSSEQRRQVCKHCNVFFKPGKNVRTRTRKGILVSYCLDCKKFSKFVYKS